MTIGKGKRPSDPKRDFMQVAREVVEHAIGEQMDGAPLVPSPPASKKQIAGSKGGKKGGFVWLNLPSTGRD
jgi:hypothetical protein